MTPEQMNESVAEDGAPHLAVAQRTDDRGDHHRRPLLAAQLTPLIDRVAELETICAWLMDEQVRLVTLTGPAGVGKTRLALEAAAGLADRFPDGVMLVDLAPIREPELVLPAIAHAVGCSHGAGIPLLERLSGFLAERALLLLLDNLEQVLAAASELADLLALCPGLTLLATSRVPLQLRCEHMLQLAPLPVPRLATLPSFDDLLQVPAVALFVARARARKANFVLTQGQALLVARLVIHLDGLPLALELAASHVDTLPLASILARLGDHMRLLRWEAADLPTRQRSLEAAVGWSYDLLHEDEQRHFRYLGVFVGRVSLDTLASVARRVASGVAAMSSEIAAGGESGGADAGRTLAALESLAEHSLILPLQTVELGWEQGGQDDDEDELEDRVDAEPAFGMLETVREYAEERLAAAGELEAARRAHAHAFLALAERADAQLRGRDQRAWYLRLECEHDNLRTALRWLLNQEAPAEREGALRLASALGWFWGMRGYHAEGARLLEEALTRAPQGERAHAGDAAGAAVRTMVLCWAGLLLTLQGQRDQARTHLQEALSCARQQHDPVGSARALTFLGHCATYGGEVEREQAVPLLQEAVRAARALGEPHEVALALFFLGEATQVQGHATEAVALYAEALGLFEAAGDAQAAHVQLGMIASRQEDLPSALHHLRAALETSGRLGDRWLLSVGAQAALAVLGDRGDPVGRVRLAGAAAALRQATGAGRVPWESAPPVASSAAPHTAIGTGEWEAAYREGRSLSPGEVIRLALRLLDEVAQQMDASPARADDVPATPAAARAPNVPSPLTARELEVLRLVAQGESNKAIAKHLYISPSTVNYHLISIFNKLVVDTRAHAVAVAAKLGLI